MAFKRNLGLGTRGKDPTTCKVYKKVLKMFYSKQPTQSRELRGSVINGNYHQRTLAGSIINNQKVMNYKTRQNSICRQFMIKLSVDQNLVVILQADSFQQFRRPNPQDLMIMTIDTNIEKKKCLYWCYCREPIPSHFAFKGRHSSSKNVPCLGTSTKFIVKD